MKETRSLVEGEGVAQLLPCPFGGGVLGDGDVQEPTPLVAQDHEAEQQPERQRRDDEEVDAGRLAVAAEPGDVAGVVFCAVQ